MRLSVLDLKKLMFIPIIMLVVAVSLVASGTMRGTIPMGVDLKGGTLITIYAPLDRPVLEERLSEKFDKVSINTIKSGIDVVGYTVQLNRFLGVDEKKELINLLTALGATKDDISIRDAQASISSRTLKEGLKAMAFAFLFMALVIFLRFRTFVPSFAVVLSAFSDIVVTIAVMIVLGIPLTAGSIVALLLLIGYSVDTDILLTTRLLVQKAGKFEERLLRAMKTGLTMAFTTISAVAILYIASASVVLKEIAVVILIGLVVDLLNTWIQNARILQWYLERK
jgi:preprotein translocase subunit SecF